MIAVATDLPTLVTSFFTRHLAAERNASGHTIRSYRDTFRLFLRHVAESTGRQVAHLTLPDLTPDAILSFLDYLEQGRSNSVATRNARLAALHSFFSYVVRQEAATASLAQRVLAIPFKRGPGRLLDHLNAEELRAILARPDRTTVKGRRDYFVIALLYDTGARVQKLLDLCPVDFRLDRLPLVRFTGKGRKQRIVPLLPATAKLVQNHLAETGRAPDATSPLLANHRGEKLTRSGVSFLLEQYRRLASEDMPTLQRAGISPHTLRHYVACRTMSGKTGFHRESSHFPAYKLAIVPVSSSGCDFTRRDASVNTTGNHFGGQSPIRPPIHAQKLIVAAQPMTCT